MRKIFLLIPILAFAITVNAKIVEVYPTSPNSTDNIRRAVRDNAVSGDIIMLMSDDAMYEESADYMILDKDVTIMPAEGKHPTIKMSRFAELKNSAKVKFIGIKFDGSYAADASYGRCLRPYDTSEGKSVKFENCEFYGFKSHVIYCSDSYNLDSCFINNCYFHNNAMNAVYFAKSSNPDVQTAKGIIITNSTFTAIGTSETGSVIEVSNQGAEPVVSDVELTVDHCTFYNNQFGSGSHAPIRASKLGKLTITNCIFVQSTSCSKYATYCYGGVVDHCLVFNLNGHRDYDSHPTITNPITATSLDAIFADVTTDLSLAGTYPSNISPARGAATDGSDLGDPRWHTDIIYPTTNFAAPGYIFTAVDAAADAGIEKNTHYGEDAAYLRYTGSTPTSAVATWKIKATRACHVDVIVNMADNGWNYSGDSKFQNGKHIFGVELYNSLNQRIDTVAEGLYENGSALDGYDTYPNVNLGSIEIPEEGVYTVKLINCRSWSKCGVSGVTMVYSGGAVQNMPGTTEIDEAWFSSNGTRTSVIDFPDDDIQNGWAKWNVTFANSSNYKVKVKVNTTSGHNYTVKLYRNATDPSPITFANGVKYSQTGTPVDIEIEPQLIEAGNYIMEVTNSLQNSDAKLISVQFVYAGGGTINIPATLAPMDAVFSPKASVIDNKIDFSPSGSSSTEWAKWNIYSKGGKYTFTINAYNSTQDVGQTYNIKVFSPTSETNPVIDKTSSWDQNAGNFEFTTPLTEIAKGNYVVKIQNTTDWSVGRVVNVVANYYGGATIDIPGTLPLEDALLSPNAYRNDGATELHFIAPANVSHVASEWAKWNVHVETEGVYQFTLNVVGTNHGVYTLTVDEGASVSKGKSGSASVTLPPILLTQGDHVIKIANTNNYADGYLTAVSAAPVANTLVLDEMDEDMSVISSNTGSHIPALKRTFRTGVYNSICVPFNVNDELTSIFGEGYELLTMTSATLEGGVLTLNFAPASTIAYGTPYLIKPTKDVINPVFNAHSVSASTSHLTVAGSDANLVGVLYKQDLGTHPENLYLGADGNLYFSNTGVTIKGFRAYFHINVTNAQQVVKHARIVTQGHTVTAIDLVSEPNEGTVKIIENGQLIIIKNGVRYNIQGQKIQ